jgi:hypothetical protein
LPPGELLLVKTLPARSPSSSWAQAGSAVIAATSAAIWNATRRRDWKFMRIS